MAKCKALTGSAVKGLITMVSLTLSIHTISGLLLAGAPRQPLLSVILFRSIYVCFRRFSPLQSARQLPDAWRGVSPKIAYTARLQVNVIYFPAHCAGVTNMSLRDNLSAAVKIYRRHRRIRFSSASQKDYRLVLSSHAPKSCAPMSI